MTKQMKKYEIKDNYNDIQIMDVEMFNVAISELNRLYSVLDEENSNSGDFINMMNKKIDGQKDHMKRVKPSWLKR